jgi:hypothetical protein
MSLVGNLEDLSLGDILQIISLSQKSGVLALASDNGSGRIVFRLGLVQAACLKGGANDLRELLVGRGLIEPGAYEACRARSREFGMTLEDCLASEAGLSAERIDGLVRDAVEASILEMFSWPSGDFSFDVRIEVDPEDPQLILPTGINAQYLAMEGLRVGDERARDQEQDCDTEPNTDRDPSPTGLDLDPIFGTEILERDAIDAEAIELDVIAAPSDSALSVLETVLSEDSIERVEEVLEVVEEADGGALEASGVLVANAIERAEAELETPDDPATMDASARNQPAPPCSSESVAPGAFDAERPPAAIRKMPVVLIDPEVSVLEWVKAAIEDEFLRVHVFQQAEQGLARIRQYLIRGETPLVLISPDAQIDSLSGIHGLGDFVRRLKTQAPRLVVLGLREDEDTAASAMPTMLDGVLRRPARRMIADRNPSESAISGQVLVRALLEILTQRSVYSGRPKPASARSTSLSGLRDTTARLQEASSRGEILPVVLDFASEVFDRVAILIVRDDEVFPIAGRGIPSLEVDPLDCAPPVSLDSLEAGWVRRALDTRSTVTAPPGTEADRALLECFGAGEEPESVYLGPIESGSTVIALLYGDQSISGAPMPDTSGLEVVLHHAGMALDRAVLERALLEAESGMI